MFRAHDLSGKSSFISPALGLYSAQGKARITVRAWTYLLLLLPTGSALGALKKIKFFKVRGAHDAAHKI